MSRTSPDCLLLCGTSLAPLHCHRTLLAAHSNLLKHSLAEAGEQTLEETVLLLPDFSKQEVDVVLEVMYGDKKEVAASREILLALGLTILLPARSSEEQDRGEFDNNEEQDESVKARTVSVGSETS